MNKCEKCGLMHYRTEPCRKPKAVATQAAPKPKRTGNRHRPGYFTEYMRDYRKGIRRSKSNPNTPERNDK